MAITVLKLDLDYASIRDVPMLKERGLSLCWHLGVDVLDYTIERSSGGGIHLTMRVQGYFPPLAIVAMQAILGSDYRRETFNLVRALTLDSAPAFWRKRWNVLYASKLEDGRMINPDDYGKSKPTIKAAMFPGVSIVPLTIDAVDLTDLKDDQGNDIPKIVLTFREFQGDKGATHAYWPNVTSIRNLVAKLGEDESKWPGQRVPFVKVRTNNPRTKKQEEVLWIADPDDDSWDARRTPAPRARTAGAKAKAKGRR